MTQAFRQEPAAEDVPDAPSSSLPPLDDPYLLAPPAMPRARMSKLAVRSVVALIPIFGPVGSVCAIVFGLAARREIARSEAKRGGGALALAGVVLGVVMTMGWGAYLGWVLWSQRAEAPEQPVAAVTARLPLVPPDDTAPSATPAAPVPAHVPGANVPKETVVRREGAITVVDVGKSVSELDVELAKQRAEAVSAGETVLVMTTRGQCDPCRDFERALRDPLMQTALAKVRLVRVDIEEFKDDLDELKMPRRAIPGFFLLSLDLTPRDGIDGGEWDDDIPSNIAPVIGAFVRGKYGARRQGWQPVPSGGVRL